LKALGESPVSVDVKKIRQEFHNLLTKANKERPKPTDIQALNDLLHKNNEMELWKAVVGMGELAESQALDTIVNGSGQGIRVCWRQRLQAMRADLGYAESSALERLLIQQVTLCWLNLNLTEYRHINVLKQPITLAAGIYWEKRLTAAAAHQSMALRPGPARLSHHQGIAVVAFIDFEILWSSGNLSVRLFRFLETKRTSPFCRKQIAR